MQLTDFVDGVPDDVWAIFEPILPPKPWCGVGRKPKGNRECLHGLLYVLVVRFTNNDQVPKLGSSLTLPCLSRLAAARPPRSRARPTA